MEDDGLEAPSSLLHRIRSVKSMLSIKHKYNVRRTLRHIETLASLTGNFRLGALKGKTLEELARLGGYSFLHLRAEYAPAPLKLPMFLAATAVYLLRHGKRHGDILVLGYFAEKTDHWSKALQHHIYLPTQATKRSSLDYTAITQPKFYL